MSYAKNACRTLGLIDEDTTITSLGAELLKRRPGSGEEAKVLRRAVENSPVLTEIVPAPFSGTLDKASITRKLQELYGFSETTARDRSSNFVSWVAQIIKADSTSTSGKLENGPQAGRPKAGTIQPRSGPAGLDTEDDLYASPPLQIRGASERAGKVSPRGSKGQTPARNNSVQEHRQSRESGHAEHFNRIPALKLPRRYETLRAESEKADVDLFNIVQRVESAAQRIDYLLRKVREGGTGLFEVFFGPSGSGKTTFLQTLPKFFDQVRVTPVEPGDGSLDDFAKRVQKDFETLGEGPRVYFFEDRDNENLDDARAERFFESLRVLFRKKSGRVLVVWPVTRPETRETLASKSWAIGADSIVSVDTKGVYDFKGIPREQFFEVADVTALNLNGESLEGYGISREVGEALARSSETISIFFDKLEGSASERRQEVWSILRERVLPRLWVVLAGDLGDYLDGTISRLTQGRNYRIDIERLLDFLDDPENDSLYLQEWRDRRSSAAHLFRILDVRLIPLHPGGVVAAIRGFGSDVIRSKLRRNSMSKKEAIEVIHCTPLYKLILKELQGKPEPYSKGRPPSKDTVDEYKRVQSLAKSGDKGLNHAVGAALRASLEFDGYTVELRAEKKGLGNTNLQPDVQIPLNEAEVICLETTWRTSGKGISGELDSSQNSMSPGNIQKYILQKVMEYVRALRL